MKFAKVRDVKSPQRGTLKAAGIDFFVPSDFEETTILPGHDLLIPSGIKVEIPENYMLLGADKSGVVTSKGACEAAGRTPKKDAFDTIMVIGAKVIDEDYTGEIHIHVFNAGVWAACIKPGMKIAQFILVPVLYEDLEEVPEAELFEGKAYDRGSGAFGSTGTY